MDNIFTKITKDTQPDTPLPEAPLLDTEEKMRRFIIQLATQVQQIQDTLTRNKIT